MVVVGPRAQGILLATCPRGRPQLQTFLQTIATPTFPISLRLPFTCHDRIRLPDGVWEKYRGFSDVDTDATSQQLEIVTEHFESIGRSKGDLAKEDFRGVTGDVHTGSGRSGEMDKERKVWGRSSFSIEAHHLPSMAYIILAPQIALLPFCPTPQVPQLSPYPGSP